MLSWNSEDKIWSRFVVDLVTWPQEVTLAKWTQPSGPLCLWQCLKSWWLIHSKHDDRYLSLVILFTLVTLVTLLRSYNQFYRAECITILGLFSPSPKSYLLSENITVDERVWENSKQKYPVGVSGFQEGGVTYPNHEILFHAYNDRTGGLVDWHRVCILSLSLRLRPSTCDDLISFSCSQRHVLCTAHKLICQPALPYTVYTQRPLSRSVWSYSRREQQQR